MGVTRKEVREKEVRMRRAIGTIALVLTAFVLWPADAAFATPISVFASNSSIQTFRFPPQSNFDSFGPGDPCAGLRGCIDSTHADLNGSHISSFSEFGNGFMGARFDGSGSSVPFIADTQSDFSTSWYCVKCGPGTVGTPDGSEFVPLNVLLSITGTAADVGPGSFVELTASLSLTNGTVMTFDYSQDGTDPAGATLDVGQGAFPVILTHDLGTNTWSFSVDTDVTALVCGPDFPCQPATSPCFSTDSCSGIPSFSDTQSITLKYDDSGSGNPFFLDASDPFSVQFVSGDPSFQFASSDGQSTGPVVVATPEPATLTLMLAGVAGIFGVRRRRGTPS
jgi:hypothetical protein